MAAGHLHTWLMTRTARIYLRKQTFSRTNLFKKNQQNTISPNNRGKLFDNGQLLTVVTSRTTSPDKVKIEEF